MQKTFILKPADVERKWHIIDVSGKVLGRAATEIAQLLIGKAKKEFTPHVDNGDCVVVINASKVEVTGTKIKTKMYYRHSNFPGGLKTTDFGKLLAKKPEQVIELAVLNMLPKNKHRSDRMTRLKVYPGADHKHQSQLGVKEA
ncbi:MAG: 50S ribosomal protein L13 [Candidatus Pacebacteria bacterium CG_4_10_14_0_8_um_filter_42_14]|nr:MAG: 50S ribosomal protein L13 [Candidatus Pacebacteria bacterium CG_4_10_14_0_8_um_filter_42_14]